MQDSQKTSTYSSKYRELSFHGQKTERLASPLAIGAPLTAALATQSVPVLNLPIFRSVRPASFLFVLALPHETDGCVCGNSLLAPAPFWRIYWRKSFFSPLGLLFVSVVFSTILTSAARVCRTIFNSDEPLTKYAKILFLSFRSPQLENELEGSEAARCDRFRRSRRWVPFHNKGFHEPTTLKHSSVFKEPKWEEKFLQGSEKSFRQAPFGCRGDRSSNTSCYRRFIGSWI